MDRLWAKIKKGGPDECWEWTGSRSGNGYGRLRVDGKLEGAHRLVWAEAYGDPGDAHVLHTCDNPPCCNPAHLFLGDPGVNARDRASKGRQHNFPVGEGHPNTTLTEADVRLIRSGTLGLSQRALGRHFGVTHSTIKNIIARRTWQHVR